MVEKFLTVVQSIRTWYSLPVASYLVSAPDITASLYRICELQLVQENFDW